MEKEGSDIVHYLGGSKQLILFNTHVKCNLMWVFHWSRPVGNYVLFGSRDQCLHGRLGSVVVSRLVGKSR